MPARHARPDRGRARRLARGRRQPPTPARGSAPLQEVQQRLVELRRVRQIAAMRAALDQMQLAARDRAVRARPADFERHRLVAVAMDHQRGNVEFLQVVAEVGARERGDALVRALRRREGGNREEEVVTIF